ncbi:MAG TPA: PPOX class F420-dependent oxidoreductase [Blastocatellia bacterium]|nr:PPOX class F420-dependent oxidoreductase [Blastocatellia bacterium]
MDPKETPRKSNPNPALKQFAGQNYLNLQTFRKNGVPVDTPVWFAEKDGVLYIYSLADAGKVKRIRNNSRVRLVPSDMRGKPRGEWVEGAAVILDEQAARLAHQFLNQKYWLKRVGDLFSKLRKRRRAVIAITV